MLLGWLSAVLWLVGTAVSELGEALIILQEMGLVNNVLRTLLFGLLLSFVTHLYFNGPSFGYRVEKATYQEKARKIRQSIKRLEYAVWARGTKSYTSAVNSLEPVGEFLAQLPTGRPNRQWGRLAWRRKRRRNR